MGLAGGLATNGGGGGGVPGKLQAGTGAFVANASVAVTFPVPFINAPVVLVDCSSTTVFGASSAVSATGFTALASAANSQGFSWIAYSPTG